MIHHLLEAKQSDIAQKLLRNPFWVERKLRLWGAPAVIDDYRNYLKNREDHYIRLMLLAFQMSYNLAA